MHRRSHGKIPPFGWGTAAPLGERVRGQYDVGRGGTIFGAQKVLILEYGARDTVVASRVAE